MANENKLEGKTIQNLYEWKEETENHQNELKSKFSDRYWDRFRFKVTENEEISISDDKESARNLFFRKIAYAIYGGPKEVAADCGLKDKEKAIVDEIMEKCINHSVSRDYVDVACIFVFIYISEEAKAVVPLFRVRSVEKATVHAIPKCKFIDHLGRVYDSFDDYKSDNTWDMTYLCFPEDGYYSEKGDICFHNQLERGKLGSIAEKASMVTGIGSAVGMLAGLGMTLFPVTAPLGLATMAYSGIIGAPGAVYGTGKSIHTLVDRSKHEKSINVKDAEARAAWLMTATGAVSIGTMGATRYLMTASQGGRLASTWVRAGVTGMMGTNVALSGVNLINLSYNLFEKKKAGEEITSLDIFQLTTSVFFFTHSAVSFKTANSIVRDIHNQESNAIRSTLSKKEQRYFDALSKAHKETVNPGKFSELEGQASFVREMYRIDNPKDYFKQIRFTPDKQFRINQEYTMDPRKFATLTNEQRNSIMTNSQKLRTGEISFEQFKQNTQPIRRDVRISSDRETMEIANNLKEKHGINVKKFNINGKNFKLKPAEIHELNNIYNNADADTLQYTTEFANKNAKTPNEYINAAKYASRNVEQKVAAEASANKGQNKQEVRQNVVKNLQETQELETNFEDASKKYEKNEAKKFTNTQSAANHYDKHGHEFADANSMKEYNEKAAKLMKDKPVEEVWMIDGKGVTKTYQNAEGEKCITFTEFNNGQFGEERILSLYKKSSLVVPNRVLEVDTAPLNHNHENLPTPTTSDFSPSQNLLSASLLTFEALKTHLNVTNEDISNFIWNIISNTEAYAWFAELLVVQNPSNVAWKVTETGVDGEWFSENDYTEYRITYIKTDDGNSEEKEAIISFYIDNECVMVDIFTE